MRRFVLSVNQAKTVHTAVFLQLRSHATGGREKRLIQHIRPRVRSLEVVPNLYYLLQFPGLQQGKFFAKSFSIIAIMRIHPLFIAALIPAAALAQKAGSSDALRPITFLDRQYQREVGSPTPSPDGKWLLYTLSTPDWNQARRQTDIYLVSVKDGVASTKQMTFTKDKNETLPRWFRDGKFFVFLSNRDAPSAPSGGGTGGGGASATSQNQIYVMRPDGGEARKITDAKEGVSTLDFSKDGRWLVYRSGKADEEQLYALPVAGIDSAKPVQLTHQQAAVGLWKW